MSEGGKAGGVGVDVDGWIEEEGRKHWKKGDWSEEE